MDERIKEINKNSLLLFKSVYISDNKPEKQISLKDKIYLTNECLNSGIVLHPEIFDTYSMSDLLELIPVIKSLYGFYFNYVNSTFYSSFDEVDNLSEFERRIDQLLHYCSTYGTGSMDNPYIPNSNPNSKDLKNGNNTVLTVIESVNTEELTKKLQKMYTANIALSKENIVAIAKLIDLLKIPVDIKSVQNKELKLYLMKDQNYIPENWAEFTRLMVFTASNGEYTQVISKNDDFRDSLYDSLECDYNNKINRKLDALFKIRINKFGIEDTAKHINRYRKIYLIFKRFSKKEKNLYNKVFRLSKKLHQPAKMPLLENILNAEYTETDLEQALSKASSFKLVKLMNYLKGIQNQNNNNDKLYIIRNGNSFIKEDSKKFTDIKKVVNIKALIIKELQKRYSKKLEDYSFYIPKDIEYSAPTSNKNFIGTMPAFTKITFNSSVITLGVSWNIQADLDLHAQSLNGNSYGWNDDYDLNGVIYSGDMTALNPHTHAAAEFIQLDAKHMDNPQPIIFNTNKYYSDEQDVKFDLFITLDKNLDKDDAQKDVIIDKLDPSSILVKQLAFENKMNKSLAIAWPIKKNRKWLWEVSLISTNLNNSRVQNNDLNAAYTKAVQSIIENQYTINNFLNDIKTDNSALYIYDDEKEFLKQYKQAEKQELDLNKFISLAPEIISQDTILNIFN